MKKSELVTAIIEDMCSKNPGKEKTIILEWRPWLNRQHKFYLEKIYTARMESKNH